MKKIFLLSLLALSFYSHAQFVSIPDNSLRNKLITLYPSCFNASQLMDTTCSGIVNATSLIVSSSSILNFSGIQYFDNLDSLDFSSNIALTNFPSLPSTLSYINCDDGVLVNMTALPPNLLYLSCDDNNITGLPTLPSTLTYLDCSWNQLTSLPALNNPLSFLDCSGNQLGSLSSLPASLTELNCSSCQLTSLPTIPNSITSMSCGYNSISMLPALPNSILYLSCAGNALTSLPALPNSLLDFNCSDNDLVELLMLPNDLKFINCSYNKLNSLPLLPNKILDLNCNFNQIFYLPSLPDSLRNLSCTHNQLTSLPPLGDSLNGLDCSDNVLLNCIPRIPLYFQALWCTNTSVTCIPNGNAWASTWGFPLCGSGSPCEPLPICSGVVFNDLNSNGVYDNTIDKLLPNWLVTNSNNFSSTSMTNGGYRIKLDTSVLNNFTLNPLIPYCTITPSNYTITPIGSGSQGDSFHFAVVLTPNINDLQASIACGAARPGFNQWVNTSIQNVGTLNATNATVKILKPNAFTFLNATPSISSQVGDTLIWTNINLSTFQQKGFSINWNIPSSLPIGTKYQIETWVSGSSVDATPANNYFLLIDTLTGSYDPNDKTVHKQSITPASLGNDLVYTIRFQNTGTDTAFNILIRDTLSENLDLGSFNMLAASHGYNFLIREKGLLEVFFSNIKLVDSFTNEPESHGFFQYAVKPKAGLTIGDTIENTASIYFDFNTPIITNTVHTIVVISTGVLNVSKIKADIIPNPNSGRAVVQLFESEAMFTLSNLYGSIIMKQPVKNGTLLDFSNLMNGIYIGSIEGKSGIKVFKILKKD